MCGIVGYVGGRSAAPVLLEGLKKLEYRGYDSAGIALVSGDGFSVVKRSGRVSALEFAAALRGDTGIGHTRWATHGAPTEANAHPHVYGKFAVVHNGIIENYLPLKEECLKRGEIFASQTDSEVVAHLLQESYEGDPLAALFETAKRLKGSFALCVLCSDFPHEILCARRKSPLVASVGKWAGEMFVASDIPAIAAGSREIYSLGDGEFAVLRPEGITFYGGEGKEISKERVPFDPCAETPVLGNFRHFMRKEMAEIPAAITKTVENLEASPHFSAFCEVLCHAEYLQIVACGTAYHSALAAKYAFERIARFPVEADVASEYRYRDPIVRRGTLMLAVSQSGETADTIAAARLAKEKGATVAAITNVTPSSLSEIADFTLETRAGREVAVAATKSYCAQLALLYSLVLLRAGRKKEELLPLAAAAERVLSSAERAEEFAQDFARAGSCFFLGRGADHCAALEGSLKLKEISYLPSEGYPAGELKHGTLALIGRGTPVVAVLTDGALAEKTMNAVSEVYARGGKVFLVTCFPEYAEREEVAAAFPVPKCDPCFSPILSVIPLQALAYYTALARGNDPDKPRNLAKSVTVE